jgi:hypothetical protein
MPHDGAQLDDWIQRAEAWVDEQWAELRRQKDQARELLRHAQDPGKLKSFRADLAALKEDMESGMQQLEALDAAPSRLLIKAGAFLVELDELVRDLEVAT